MAMAIALPAAAQEEPRTGWVFTPFPDVSYNSDIGLNLGGFCDFFYYGDGTDYPNFQHLIAVCGAWATKGSWYLHGMFDSKTLVALFAGDGAEPILYQDATERIHCSAGIGGKIHMNTNIILSLEVGKGFNPQLSELTVAMATTYLF